MDKELDAWIAENIFNGEFIGSKWNKLPRKYTSDMNEAVKLMDKMWLQLEPDGVGWLVIQADTFNDQARSWHKKPTMAICLAAYRLKTGHDWKGDE